MLALINTNPILWLLLVISIASLAIIVEKVIFLSRLHAPLENEKLSTTIKEIFRNQTYALTNTSKASANEEIMEKGRAEARLLCIKAEPQNLSAQTLRLLIENHSHNRSFLEEMAFRENERKIMVLEKRLFLLGTFSAIAPLLGLLGTVLGMMLSFASFSQNEMQQGILLSRGISQALLTTAAGLIIAIPSLFFYNYFVRKINLYRASLAFACAEVIELLKSNNSH